MGPKDFLFDTDRMVGRWRFVAPSDVLTVEGIVRRINNKYYRES